MIDIPTHWTVRHFSLANPAGPGCDSVPALLRRLADAVEALGPAEIQDVVFESEMTEHGPWRSATVYFHLPGDGDGGGAAEDGDGAGDGVGAADGDEGAG